MSRLGADALELPAGDGEVGGQLLQGDELQEVGHAGDEFQISLFGGEAVHVDVAAVGFLKELLCRAGDVSGVGFFEVGLHFGYRHPEHFRVGAGHYRCGRGL